MSKPPLPPVNDEESPIETPVDALMGEPTDVIMDPNLEFADLIQGSAIDLAGDNKPRDSAISSLTRDQSPSDASVQRR